MVKFFGNNTDKNDAEVRYLLTHATWDRILAEKELYDERLAKAEQAMLEAEADWQDEVNMKYECGVYQLEQSGVYQLEAQPDNLAVEFGFEDNNIRWPQSQIPPGLELGVLVLVDDDGDELEYKPLIGRYEGEDYWMIRGLLDDDAVSTLQEAGRL